MKSISLLDCTLRDGGYCNQWNFGQKNIRKIIMGLEESGVEIIECGFLNESIMYNHDITRYTLIDQVENFITKNRKDTQYVCMVNYCDIDIEAFPEYKQGMLSGIRVAFHKKDMIGALGLCRRLKEKGYKVYVQPMVVLDYTDEEFLQLVHMANDIKPYAFYIVDSFGVMKKRELVHIYYMTDHNLDDDITIGFHSHNNMQLSYSNAQALLEIQGNRDIIIDCSIFGMGRGAGNLNTELFEQYLNDNYAKNYLVNPLLIIYDEILSVFYNQKSWGYSLANYLSASYNCHPNYASYLEDKNTLAIGDIDKIFQRLDHKKKNSFDSKYIEGLYQQYIRQNTIHQESIEDFKRLLLTRNILIIAAGKSGYDEKEKIVNYIKEHQCLVISTNTVYPFYDVDYVFVSNIRRYKQIDKGLKGKMIVTSNILCDKPYLMLDYDKYTNEYEAVTDNAVLMLMKYLKSEGVKKIALAGLDGYSHAVEDNYGDKNLIIRTSSEIFDQRNKGLNCFIDEYKKSVDVEAVTYEKYIRIN